MEQKQRRTRIIFQLLGFYVLFQFFWWAFHIIQLHGEIFALQHQLNVDDPAYMAAYELYQKKVWMVAGEGAVFMLLLIVGMWRIAATMKKEAALTKQERNFTLAITHELKTPVATLRLFLETMQSRELTKDQQEKILSDAVNETHRLDHLVENILLSKRLEQKADAQKGVVNLSRVVEERAMKLKHVLCADHLFSLKVVGDCVVNGDQLELESLLTNLIDNARKYTPSGSEIEVNVFPRNNEIILAVGDRGPGIPKEERMNVFKKFYRVGNEDTRNSKGTGLGLYIVSRIAHQHNGTVGILERPGGGAIFEVAFPKNAK
ncbi:MAG: HAMP domain-containing sensor histidine kinase [Flavobacteriales bacterium]|nr:HAMP domain-containing sensor histidine kinase [Flavobacteriales bacterium]MDG1779821.1 HAMP domain-containing sensor histidine kinase [Flavobacteriales bacterium]MDG2245599.1 HAMP domain-containing sensor histidine kinase [Flavobacteriales bacterium]